MKTKQKKIGADTSYDSIYDRFVKGNLLKGDYQFIAAIFSQFKNGNILYTILSAKIRATIQLNLRNPQPSSEAQRIIGRMEGLDAALALIDELALYDAHIRKEEETEVEEGIDNERLIPNTQASIE